jgi:uncharacterized membrane protein
MKNMKGQFLIVGVLMIFMTLIVLATLSPMLWVQIQSVFGATNDTTTQGLALLIFPFMIIAVLMAIAYYMPQ